MSDNHEQDAARCRIEEIALNEDEKSLLAELGNPSRREFLGQVSGATAALIAAQMLTENAALAFDGEAFENAVVSNAPIENAVTVKMKINGAARDLTLDSRVTLLDALREKLQLTGSKKGCDHGQCGACTVIVDGRRVLSCLTLTASCEGKEITTIEGLAKGEQLHPVQAAFIKHDGFQCGYCTPGQICSAVALMTEAKNGEASYVTANLRTNAKNLKLSDEEIRERMSGNICRCGAYPNIVTAIREVHTGVPQNEQAWQFFQPEGEKQNETV